MYVHTWWTGLKYVLPIQLYTCIHVCTQTCINISTYICTCMYKLCRAIYFNTFQHTAEHCDTLRHTAILYSTQFLASVCTYSSQMCVCVCAFVRLCFFVLSCDWVCVFLCVFVYVFVCALEYACLSNTFNINIFLRLWATDTLFIFGCVCVSAQKPIYTCVRVCVCFCCVCVSVLARARNLINSRLWMFWMH